MLLGNVIKKMLVRKKYTVLIGKKSMYKCICTVQTLVVQGQL